MSSSNDVGFRYWIRPREGGWSWAAFDESGQVRAEGEAPTKAIAAAFVIRTIARACAAPPEA